MKRQDTPAGAPILLLPLTGKCRWTMPRMLFWAPIPAAVAFAGKDFFRSDITFRDINQNKTLRHWLHCREEIAEAVFNTAFADISGRQWLNIARQLFPFTPGKFKAGFSCGDLSGRLIDKMSASLKDIRCGWRLTGFKEKDKQLLRTLVRQAKS